RRGGWRCAAPARAAAAAGIRRAPGDAPDAAQRPRRPAPPKPPRGRPPPPPPPPPARSRASLTFSLRPCSSWPFSSAIARSASLAELISTKPKPRDRPVARSVITAADSQVPACEKSASRSALVVSKERLPTNSFLPMSHSWPLGGRSHSSVAWARSRSPHARDGPITHKQGRRAVYHRCPPGARRRLAEAPLAGSEPAPRAAGAAERAAVAAAEPLEIESLGRRRAHHAHRSWRPRRRLVVGVVHTQAPAAQLEGVEAPDGVGRAGRVRE